MRIFKILASSVVLLCSISAFGQLQSEYLHQPRISTRVMGMGGAFTAVADDYQALYYNPAGLARLEQNQFVADIVVGATPAILSFESQLSGAGSNPTNIQNALSQNFGSHFSSRVGLGGTWVGPKWGIGFQPFRFNFGIRHSRNCRRDFGRAGLSRHGSSVWKGLEYRR